MANKGVNKVFLLGNLGKNPEVRYLPNGNAVTNFSIATSESWKDKNTGQQQEKVEWHRIVIFGKLAEIAGEYLKKGSQVFIQGKLQTNKWQDQDGKDRYTTEIVASEMQMIGSRGNNTGNTDEHHSDAMGQQNTAYQQSNQQQSPVASYDGFDDFDHDIPF